MHVLCSLACMPFARMYTHMHVYVMHLDTRARVQVYIKASMFVRLWERNLCHVVRSHRIALLAIENRPSWVIAM